MKIIIDMDGIVVNTLPTWLDRIHEETGVRAYCRDITNWNLNQNEVFEDVKPQVMWDILDEPGFTEYLPPMPEAIKNLYDLHQDGHDLSIVTARYGKHCIPETVEWLAKHMPWFNSAKGTWFGYNKDRIVADAIIDDKAETLIAYKKAHPDAHLITIDYPYNQHAPKETYRVANNVEAWTKIRNHIRNL